MPEAPCRCGTCEDCRKGKEDRFSRRGVLGALVGASALAASQATPKENLPAAPDPAVALAALEREAFAGLKGLFVAEKSYFAERDRYSSNLNQIGFEPDPWCEDGARLQIKEAATEYKKIGCHFIYEVETLGDGPAMQFRAYARGAVDFALGMNYLVDSGGPFAGMPRRSPK